MILYTIVTLMILANFCTEAILSCKKIKKDKE